MALLFTFVLFGASLIWSGFTVISWSTLAFAVVVLLGRRRSFSCRWPAQGSNAGVSSDCLVWASRLSSLLLVLLPVFAGLPGSEHLFAICCLVVLFSVVVNGGGSPMLLVVVLDAVPFTRRHQ